MANGDQVQYIKLPDGSFGKFRIDATDAQIKGQISKLFPTAYVEAKPSPITDKTTIGPKSAARQNPLQQLTGQGALQDFVSTIKGYTQQGRAEHPYLAKGGDVLRNIQELLVGGQAAGKPMGTKTGLLDNPVTMAISMAPSAAETATTAMSKLSKGEPLARLNKILGVGPKEVRVGATPSTLDEFASNPARGVVKAGIPEKELAKMNPLERVQTITKVRDAAGAKLDQVLQANPQKTINVQKSVDDVFAKLSDKRLQKLAEARLRRILSEAKITKPLSQLTPMEARTVQRGLDDFANFAPEGTYKSFSDIATGLRREISKATRQAIPETAELDQDYGDLAGATKAVRRQANKYARTVPESKLRKIAPYIAGAVGGSAAAAGARYLLPATRPAP